MLSPPETVQPVVKPEKRKATKAVEIPENKKAQLFLGGFGCMACSKPY